MALFKKRKGADEPLAPAKPAESIEAMRRRARHRLIGAVVLVLVAVVGFPILFDTQPRPVAVDIPIDIPDRNKVKPLPAPPALAVGKVTPESAIITEAKEPEGEAPAAAPVTPVTPPAPAVAAAPPVAPAAPPRAPEPKPVVVEKPAKVETAKVEPPAPAKKPEPKPVVSDDAAKARALLDGRTVDTAASGQRFVVQVGAFAEQDKAKAAQQKLERAGLKNYTNVAETKDGKRIRVRAGPFASRAEADSAVEKIKGLDLPAAILTL